MGKLKTKSLKILDVGSVVGDDLDMLNKFGTIYALDLDQKTLDVIPDTMVVEKVRMEFIKIHKNHYKK